MPETPGPLVALVERAQRGDEVAFEALIGGVGRRLYSVALMILRDPGAAEDAVQDALVNVWRHLPRLRDPERFDAWAYRIVVHAAYAESRRRRSTAWSTGGVVESVEFDPIGADATTGVGDRDEIERGFRTLSIEHRSVVVLKHYLGLSDAEIATVLELPEGTVRSRLFYGVKALRSAIDDLAGGGS